MANGEVDTDVRSAKKAEDFVPEFLGFHIATIGVQYLLSIFTHPLHPATKKKLWNLIFNHHIFTQLNQDSTFLCHCPE